METLLADIRQGFRLLLKSPGFTLVALAAIALGIGANTGIFSVVDRVLLQPLPYSHPDRIVQVGRMNPDGYVFSNSIPKYMVWRTNQNVFSAMALFDHDGPGFNLGGAGRPEQVKGVHVSAEYFKVFGVSPLRGRTFTQIEDLPNGPKAAMISEALWKSHFSSDPNILNRAITLNSEPYPVIAVIPDSFVANPPAEVWIPLQANPNSDNHGHYLSIAARLKDGVTLQQGQAQLRHAGEVFRRIYPKSMGDRESVAVEPLRDASVRNLKPALLILEGAVGVVLLIACANVANLLLARAAARQREISIRSALGATRGRLIRQLLTESVILSGLGGVLGLAAGVLGVHSLLLLEPGDIPRLSDPSQMSSVMGMVDWRMVLFTVAVSVFTGLLFGLLPAWHASSLSLASTLKEASGRSSTGSRRHSFVRKALVVSEMGLAVVLLIAAALLIRTFVGLSSVNSGIDARNVLTWQTSLAGDHYATTERVALFTTQVLRRLQALPGVDSAAAAIALPVSSHIDLPFNLAGQAPKTGIQYNGDEQWRSVTSQYFSVFRIPLLNWRMFNERDTLNASRVLLINRAMAKKYWKDENPIGQVMTIAKGFGPLEDQAREIIGVVGDVRETGLTDADVPVMYIPENQQPEGMTALANSAVPLNWGIRSRLDPKTLSTAILREIQAVDGQMPITKVQSMEKVLAQTTARQNFNMLLLTAFGAMALILAGIGIYGLMSYAVEQQTSELGIRMALGADKHQLFGLVLKQGMTPALIGVALGLMAAFGAARILQRMLFGVKPYDPISFGIVAFVLIAVALFAVYMPARRAMLLDPVIALRQE